MDEVAFKVRKAIRQRVLRAPFQDFLQIDSQDFLWVATIRFINKIEFHPCSNCIFDQ